MSSSLLVTGLDDATLEDVCRILRERGYSPIVSAIARETQEAAAEEALTVIPEGDEHPVESATREAAASALEDALVRDEQLWQRARAAEEARLGRYTQKPTVAGSAPVPAAPASTRAPTSANLVVEIWQRARTADYFAVLGVDPDAEDPAIEAAHRLLSDHLRVDRWVAEPALLRKAEEALAVIEEARAVLMNPGLKAAYKAHLAARG